jgi:hypothetical protein
MDYQAIYIKLIEKARSNYRVKGQSAYYEAHHIIPECLGGEGSVRAWRNHPNIVLLTPKEHYIAHLLLCEIYPNEKKLKYALWRMANPGNRPSDYKMSSSGYSRLRKVVQQQLCKQATGVPKSEQTIAKLKKPKPPRSQQHIDNLKKAAKEGGFKGPVKDENWYKAVSKPILQFDKGQNLIAEWDSIQQASTKLNINRSDIGSVCNGRYKTAGGFIWKFKELSV